MCDNEMIVFENLYNVQKWDNELFSDVCKNACGDVEQNLLLEMEYKHLFKISQKHKQNSFNKIQQQINKNYERCS